MKFPKLLILLYALLLVACSTSTKDYSNQKTLVIYGSRQCDHCLNFMSEMDKEGVTYVFNDVDESDKNVTDMLDWVRSSGFQGQISFPVVVLDYRDVYVAAEPEEILDLL